MLDLYFWAHLPIDLCQDESQIQESVTKAKRSIEKLEAKVMKCKETLTSLNLVTEADECELYSCEDKIETLLHKLVNQRRKLLKKSFDYCIVKLNVVERSIKNDAEVETNYVHKVAFFCKDVLKKITHDVPLHLAEVDIHMFFQLKEAAAKCLRAIIDRVKSQIGNDNLGKRAKVSEEKQATKHFKEMENSNVLVE
mmetsp:Transcript_14304/g.26944  ORF Transcript_14304/g.26944 Transcript_14304/m.26944 type:complete len:196 (+) Transcript_14304:330-917(+)